MSEPIRVGPTWCNNSDCDGYGRLSSGKLCPNCNPDNFPPTPPQSGAPATASGERDTPLKCRVENGQLIISIGVNALAFADKRRREADNETVYEFSDTEGFARDVVREMNDENDVGDSPLTDFLDSMVDAAIDNGSIYVE